MSSDERSPKRLRLSSYSPASTPTETKSTPFVQHPNTPPPSVHMSPSWHSQPLPGLGMAGSGNGGGVNFPTPPSPAAAYHSQSVAQSVGSEGGSARQTPAADNERQDMEMAEGGTVGGDGDGDVSMADDSEHRRTDHDRTEGEDTVSPLPSAVGFYLPTQPIARSQPHVSQNLLELYNLQGIQSKVARIDPVTGEKINKLRKSYEGKVKDLGLDGRNKAGKNQMELQGLLDPEWDIVIPDGRTFFEASREHVDFSERGTEYMLSMLDSALGMKPGRLPRAEDAKWKSTLGLDDSSFSKAAPAATTSSAKTAASHFLAKTSPATAVQRSAPASPRGTGAGIARPERSGKKRRYDDASWEGYDDDGYSTGDGGSRRGSGSKRQKRKDFPNNSTATSPAFSSNNGGGSSSSMVGVRSS